MTFMVICGHRCEEMDSEQLLDCLGLNVRPFNGEHGYALLTNVCAIGHVRDVNNRRVPISVTRVIRHADLIRCGAFGVRYLERPIVIHKVHAPLDEVVAA